MLSSAAERAEIVRPLTLAKPGAAGHEAELRAELERLNAELKELKSTDFAVRAYFESWLALVSGSVAAKLLFDWQKTHARTPWFAIPLAVLCLVFVADSLRQRMKQAKLAASEEVQMSRQRELRRLLGLEDAPVPPLEEAPRQAAVA